jgi:hypothetical protein
MISAYRTTVRGVTSNTMNPSIRPIVVSSVPAFARNLLSDAKRRGRDNQNGAIRPDFAFDSLGDSRARGRAVSH